MNNRAKTIAGVLLLTFGGSAIAADENPRYKGNPYLYDDYLIAINRATNPEFYPAFKVSELEKIPKKISELEKKIATQQEIIDEQKSMFDRKMQEVQEMKRSEGEKELAIYLLQKTTASLKEEIAGLKKSLDEVKSQTR
ncbi:hypothetical protein [Erwinia sp. CGal63]|uniref:hypothetical protein n=1 Tax=Erwinia sp. CGal63 TaxID=2919889 RepID=UPI00300AD670